MMKKNIEKVNNLNQPNKNLMYLILPKKILLKIKLQKKKQKINKRKQFLFLENQLIPLWKGLKFRMPNSIKFQIKKYKKIWIKIMNQNPFLLTP